MGWYIGLSLLGSVAGLMVFIVFQRRGEFDDPEEAKYQMFREED